MSLIISGLLAGAMFFLNRKNTKERIEHNKKMQQMRQEYALAREKEQHELAFKLMREGQKLQLELNQQMFQDKLKAIQDSFLNELTLQVEEHVYEEWPLKVLPWVIANQSVGNIIAKQTENFALHCILLPSNLPTFNQYVWTKLEMKLEQFFNQHWNTITGHPIYFYSGAWKRINPTIGLRGIQKPEAKDITRLHDELKNLPTVVICPEFDIFPPNELRLNIYSWGMNGEEINTIQVTPKENTYTKTIDYKKDQDTTNDAIELLVPYLECLIGNAADTYFWDIAGLKPLVPSLIADGSIYTDGLPEIKKDVLTFYNELFKQEEAVYAVNPFYCHNIMQLFEGASVLWDREQRFTKLTELFIHQHNREHNTKFKTLVEMMSGHMNAIAPTFDALSLPYKDATVIIVNGVSFKMIRVEHGTFWMGATDEQKDPYGDEKPKHKVYLTKDYLIGETPVTQALWRAVMNENPSYFGEGGHGTFTETWENLPVETVSLLQCQEFIKKLNEETGLKFRLPTEAEWEFAARGGNKSNHTQYSGSNNLDEVAWFCGNSGSQTHPVKQKRANELEIYDMSGNVWEWCHDWKGDYNGTAQTDPTGPSSASFRVNRGGGWGNDAENCRLSFRSSLSPGGRINYLGFRLALSE